MRNLQRFGSIVLVALLSHSAGCQKPADKTEDPPPSSPKGAVAGKCPAGSTGEGSYEKPCSASGDARLVPFKFVSADDNYVVFDAKNNGPYELIGGQKSLWVYDATGKRLDLPLPGGAPVKSSTSSGSITPTIKAGETKQVKFFLEKKNRPAGATTYQAEMDRAEMSTTGGTPDLVWKNPDLVKGGDRPLVK